MWPHMCLWWSFNLLDIQSVKLFFIISALSRYRQTPKKLVSKRMIPNSFGYQKQPSCRRHLTCGGPKWSKIVCRWVFCPVSAGSQFFSTGTIIAEVCWYLRLIHSFEYIKLYTLYWHFEIYCYNKHGFECKIRIT